MIIISVFFSYKYDHGITETPFIIETTVLLTVIISNFKQ